MPTISTDRLILRLPTVADIEAFDEMDADPEVMRYIGDGRTHLRAPQESVELIDRIRSRWEANGFGLRFSHETVMPANGIRVAVHALDRGDYQAAP